MFRQRATQTCKAPKVLFVGHVNITAEGTFQPTYPTGTIPGDICIMIHSNIPNTGTPPSINEGTPTVHHRVHYSDDYWTNIQSWTVPVGKGGGDNVAVSSTSYAGGNWISVFTFRPQGINSPILTYSQTYTYSGSGNPAAVTPDVETADDGSKWLVSMYQAVSNYGISTTVTGHTPDMTWDAAFSADEAEHYMSFHEPNAAVNTTYDTADTTGGRKVWGAYFTIE